jgi:hypothetical protein
VCSSASMTFTCRLTFSASYSNLNSFYSSHVISLTCITHYLPFHPPSLNLGCLHPVARVISDDVGFNPSTQRHYRKLIYYLYIHSYMFRSYDHDQVEKYITTLGLLNCQRIRCFIRSHSTVIVFIILRIVDMPLLCAKSAIICVSWLWR